MPVKLIDVLFALTGVVLMILGLFFYNLNIGFWLMVIGLIIGCIGVIKDIYRMWREETDDRRNLIYTNWARRDVELLNEIRRQNEENN